MKTENKTLECLICVSRVGFLVFFFSYFHLFFCGEKDVSFADNMRVFSRKFPPEHTDF